MKVAHGKRLAALLRSAVAALMATATVVGLGLPVRECAGVQLQANTLLVMGGNDNPTGLTPTMRQQLGGDPWYPGPNPIWFKPVGTFGQGYVDTQNNAASPYFGWDSTLIEWPAQIGLPILGQWAYEPAQQQGVHNFEVALAEVLPTLGPGERVTAFGYSSSANVMVREMRAFQNQPGGPPLTDQLDFFLMGNPNRPNGGVMQRFPGLYIPLLDIRLDGSTPVDTPYQTTDISWEYDGNADFPIYPLNLLSVVNALAGSWLLHGNYYPADVDGPRAFPDTTEGNITYITLEAPHLPLLLPFYYAGFAEPLLDLVEPALTVMVDWGYDRTISPGTPAAARLIPRINPITATVDLANAIAQGVHDFIDDLRPVRTPGPEASPSPGARTQLTAEAGRQRRSPGHTGRTPGPARAPAASRNPGPPSMAGDPSPRRPVSVGSSVARNA